MSKVEEFLTEKEERDIVEAICAAELNTSGEIRVHIEKHTEKSVMDRAKEVFYMLNMDKTKAQNGVLFYVGVEDKKFAIIGDKGIDAMVEDDFWESIRDTISTAFKKKDFAGGLIQGIINTGLKLKQYFPFQDDDVDELPNTISKG
ncbi:TPM domain-containing protein [Flavobacteriaceae bacterium F08102]|nr:TPM domain-containing protein [Flavobacteriaceae bacterium F08102]